jgi:hypothetical protein
MNGETQLWLSVFVLLVGFVLNTLRLNEVDEQLLRLHDARQFTCNEAGEGGAARAHGSRD